MINDPPHFYGLENLTPINKIPCGLLKKLIFFYNEILHGRNLKYLFKKSNLVIMYLKLYGFGRGAPPCQPPPLRVSPTALY